MGEVPRQQGCDAFDTRNRALTETTRTKVRLHFLAHRLPLGLGDLRRDTAIRNDLDIVLGHQQIDQNAIVICRIPNSILGKHFDGALARRAVGKQGRHIERGLDHETNFARMPRLDRSDG